LVSHVNNQHIPGMKPPWSANYRGIHVKLGCGEQFITSQLLPSSENPVIARCFILTQSFFYGGMGVVGLAPLQAIKITLKLMLLRRARIP